MATHAHSISARPQEAHGAGAADQNDSALTLAALARPRNLSDLELALLLERRDRFRLGGEEDADRVHEIDLLVHRLPCGSPAVAAAQVREAIRALGFNGPVGDEAEMLEGVARYLESLGSADVRPCPVVALIPQFQALLQAEGAAWSAHVVALRQGASEEKDRQQALAVGFNRAIDALVDTVASLKATSNEGAVFQLALGHSRSELVRGNDDPDVREHYHVQVTQLLMSALQVLGRDVPSDLWREFVSAPR